MKKWIGFFALTFAIMALLYVYAPREKSPTANKTNPNIPMKVRTIKTEEQSYSDIVEKTGLPTYRPSYTAGFTYAKTPPLQTPWRLFTDKNSVWYEKGGVYFHAFNGLIGDFEGLDAETVKTADGKEILLTSDGRIALWNDKVSGAAYGVEVENNSIPKDELIKIVTSFQPFTPKAQQQ